MIQASRVKAIAFLIFPPLMSKRPPLPHASSHATVYRCFIALHPSLERYSYVYCTTARVRPFAVMM